MIGWADHGRKDDLVRHPGLAPALGIRRPRLRQVEPVRDRQAGLLAGHRQADRHLAIVLLAELTAVLPRHADRMLALLRKPGVIDDPAPAGGWCSVSEGGRVRRRDRGLDRPDRRQHLLAHRGEQRPVRPRRLGDEVMQGLVRRAHLQRVHPSRHRLDALARARQDQPATVGVERLPPVGMPERHRHALDVSREPLVQPSRRHERSPRHHHDHHPTSHLMTQ